jgi:hypothetical protein
VRLFIIIYGIIVVVAWAIVAARPDYFGNVGFLVIGTAVGIYAAFLIEEYKRRREAKNTTRALFYELANRVGRCCFDFESPWAAFLSKHDPMSEFRLRKFLPEDPVIFPAVAPQIGLLDDSAAQAIIDFYTALAAWRRDLENIADQARGALAIGSDVGSGATQLLAWRLRETLEPGQRALEALAGQVAGAAEIERNAMRDADRRFAGAHPNAGKTFRERIQLILTATGGPA